jgi:hypothetical protein
MSNDKHRQDPRSSLGASRRGFLLAALIGGLVVALAVIPVGKRTDPEAAGSPSTMPASSDRAEATSATIAEKELVIEQLRAILKMRDQAYRDRNIGLLKEIYTTDCPCLRGDRGAIQQLLKDNAVWVGSTTSVQVKSFEKVNDRLWIVVANFAGSPFRIETESGELIRTVEGRSELFRFALTRTTSNRLLLGFAGPVDERVTNGNSK